MRDMKLWAAFLLVILVPQVDMAGVMGSSASGFLIQNEAGVRGVPDSVYHALVTHIAGWWDPEHTYSGDSGNLSLDARPGGCFCEALPEKGGVRHLEVVFVSPGKTLRLTGALGPLQGSGLAGSMTWSLQANGDSTTVTMTYSIGGYYQGDLPQMAPVVDSVLGSQLRRLKAFVETGKPETQ